MPAQTKLTRADWFMRLFSEGVPQLWCPPVTHYTADGDLDAGRIRAHLGALSPWVKAILVPGSTGDGWELTAAESERLLEIVLQTAAALGQRVLIGALHPDTAEARRIITSAHEKLAGPSPSESPDSCLVQNRVCGFAICPPKGADLTQADLEMRLSEVLELGLPTALYQLPQVTLNEMSPQLISALSVRFPNFLLFKDTSGRDLVARSELDFHGVFLVRGMEGAYARWLKAAGGPYDGFLLSSANCFARELHQIINGVQSSHVEEALNLSQRISQVIDDVFAAVKPVPDGNAFANGNKAIDHFMAYGPQALELPPPRLHSGRSLPGEIIRTTRDALVQQSLMPARGYLE